MKKTAEIAEKIFPEWFYRYAVTGFLGTIVSMQVAIWMKQGESLKIQEVSIATNRVILSNMEKRITENARDLKELADKFYSDVVNRKPYPSPKIPEIKRPSPAAIKELDDRRRLRPKY